MEIKLKVEKRTSKQKVVGKIPAVVYGPKTKSQSLFVDLSEFKKIWKEAGETTVIELTRSDDSKPDFESRSPASTPVLIQDVQLNPLTDEPQHVDFYAVDMTKKITAKVLLEFIGEAPAIKLGGTLVKVMHELEVESLPKDLPSVLEVDVSRLETFEDKILVKDIGYPSGVEVKAELEDMVAFVEEAMEEEVQDKEERTVVDVEVSTEKKKEEEGSDKKEPDK